MHQIHEVLLTYIRRVLEGVWPIFMVGIAALGLLQIVLLPLKTLGGVTWMAMYGPGLIAVHLKQQIIHARERRLPSAAAPHILVGAALLLCIGLATPMLRMAWTGVWCWGYPGLILAATGLTFLCIVSQSWWFSVPIVALIVSAMVPAVQQWIGDLCHGHYEETGIRLLILGIGMIAAAIVWILRLTEEDRGYQIAWGAKPGDLYRREPVQTAQSEAIKQMWARRRFLPLGPSEATLAQLALWARGSLWDRTRLWRVGLYLPLPSWIVMCLLPLFFVLQGWVLHGRLAFNPAAFIFPLYLPIITIMGAWMQKRAVWSMEILRPVSRRSYVNEMGLTLLKLIALAWSLQTLCWIITVDLLPGPGLQGPELWHYLALSAVVQMFMFAISVWIARYRSRAAWILALTVTIIASTIFVIPFTLPRGLPSDFAVGIVVALIMLLSLAIVFDAYRRWLQTELG